MVSLGALLLAGCNSAGTIDVDAPRVTVPEAAPRGALYGRLLHSDGTSVPGGSVSLFQRGEDDAASTAVKFLSLGLACLDSAAELCSDATAAVVSNDGLWYVAEDDVRPGKEVVVTATGPALPGTQATGPVAQVRVAEGPDPQRVPDLVLWEPVVELNTVGSDLQVTWPALAEVPAGSSPTYDVLVEPTGDFAPGPVAAVRQSSETSARLPGWRTEDRSARISVIARTARGRAEFVYTSPATVSRGGPVPLSRGKSCAAERRGVLVAALQPCLITDGDLNLNQQVRLPGECRVDRSGCQPPAHRRVCVDLGRSTPVSLVVVRTPFLAVDQTVELSRDGRDFVSYGPIGDDRFDSSDVFPVPVSPPASARYACVRSDDYGLSGASLNEVSVWG